MLRIPHTVCVLPVPGGPWTSVNGNGSPEAAARAPASVSLLCVAMPGAIASPAAAAAAAASSPLPPPPPPSYSYERRVCAADHLIAASCGSLKFLARKATNSGWLAISSARGGGGTPSTRGMPSFGGLSMAARMGACRRWKWCRASYACAAEDSLPAGASTHNRPAASRGGAASTSPSSAAAAEVRSRRPVWSVTGRRTPSNASSTALSRCRKDSCQGCHPGAPLLVAAPASLDKKNLTSTNPSCMVTFSMNPATARGSS
mmetsp:Transcript_10235/g.25142  ORF Transcript_10235/g.25142 Transcript_10235/m.25142 type:complete len:260 (-) Transcript_10235:957-1736(-)